MQEIFLQTTTLGEGTLLFTSDKFQIALKDQHMYLISKRYNFFGQFMSFETIPLFVYVV